jgi:5-methylcytosine-specific restriction endonuclease McrA
MSEYISPALRKLVAVRANHQCEYCRLHEQFSFFHFHMDHIISLKHGGKTTAENLAFSCSICNEYKGSDIATFLEDPSNLVRFF